MSKVNLLQTYLTEQNIEAALITNPENVFYFSGFNSHPYERLLAIMVFKDHDPFLICPKMEIFDALSSGWAFEVVGHDDIENAWDVVKASVMSRIPSFNTLAIEKSHLTINGYESIQNRFPNVSLTGIDERIEELRLFKNEDEIIKMRKAAELADYAIQVGCEAIEEGKTEMAILNIIESAIKEKGYTMSFDTMVLFGDNATSPHGKPGNRILQKGDFILFDLGVNYEGYCSDITRTVSLGEPSEEKKQIYQVVKEANEKAIEYLKPGIQAMELDKIARDCIEQAGYGEFFTHRLGHGLGISVHESPSINGKNEFVFKEGMVITVEPGIYLKNVAGVRIEDDVLITENGYEVLTKFPKALIVL